jgi:hypothetical protein
MTSTIYRPEAYGAVGDGVTNDTNAFQALAAAVNAADGGIVEFKSAATYLVGRQTAHNPPVHSRTFSPEPLLEFTDCARALIVRGHGAVIRIASGLKYGTFDTSGNPTSNPLPYFGPQIAAGYDSIIRAQGCASVTIEDLELDGSADTVSLGGQWGDTGWQLGGVGIMLKNNSGPVLVRNVYSHHQTMDGIQVDGTADDEGSPYERSVIESCRFENNGRQGLSFVGGRGWNFRNCSFSKTGRDTSGITSNPGAGIDFEAEAGKAIRDVTLEDCWITDNYGVGIVADSGTDVDRIRVLRSTIVGTTNYSVWLNRPGFVLEDCLIVGTAVHLWAGTSPMNPKDAVQFVRCTLTNDSACSPTGTVFQVNNLLIEGGVAFVTFKACLFDHATAGYAYSNGNYDQPRLENCTVRARAGGVQVSARYAGRTHFIEAGGTVIGVPNGTIVGRNNVGHAEDPWTFTANGVSTVYGATIDEVGNATGLNRLDFDGNLTLTAGVDKVTQRSTGTLTANRTWSLSTTGARPGSRFRVARSGGGAFTLSVGGLKSLATNQWCEVEYDKSIGGWALTGFGSL